MDLIHEHAGLHAGVFAHDEFRFFHITIEDSDPANTAAIRYGTDNGKTAVRAQLKISAGVLPDDFL
jgi:hypothetical protein